jgi:hypothetical protein
MTTSVMYAHTLRKDDRTRRFTITDAGLSGWEVLEVQDEQVLKHALYSDWHRVERARTVFASEAVHLRDAGWTESQS